MREILFRGKHIHSLKANEHLDGTWVYGYLCDKNYINSPELEGELLIDPSTVGQYTGLTDKNGKRIFEGDVVRLPSIYGSGYANVEFCGTNFKAIGESFAYRISGNMEIVGNVHDNPELIENA